MGERTLLKSKYLLLPEGEFCVIENAAVVVEEGKVRFAGKLDELGERESSFDAVQELQKHALMPGFVNAHTHAAMSILKNIGNGLPLERWLRERILPIEELMQEEELFYGGLLSAIEMVRSGVVAFADFYFFWPMLKVLERVPLKCLIALPFADSIEGMKEVSWRRMRDIGRHVEAVKKIGERVRLALGPHAIYSNSEEMLRAVASLSEKLDLQIHIHLSETLNEVKYSISKYGASPVRALEKMGLLSRRMIAAHAVHVDREDIEALRRHRVNVVHCPKSNARLASGIAPVRRYLESGVNVAVGTDGSASSTLDMLEELRLAIYLQRLLEMNTSALLPVDVLRMATVNGSQALHSVPVSATLERGMPADVIAINLKSPYFVPLHDVISSIVYSAGPGNVEFVMVNGKVVMEEGRIAFADEEEVMEKARELGLRAAGRPTARRP